MKVLITTDWYTTAVNGVAASVKNLAKGLGELGAEVRILTLSPSIHSYVKDNVTFISSLDVGRIYPNARVSALTRTRLLWDLAEWGPDIIHSQCEFSTFPPAVFISHRADCPIVHTYHTVYEDYTHYLFPNKQLGQNAMRIFTKEFSKHVNGLIAPTAKVSDLLIKYGCHNPVWVVPTGLDLEKLTAPKDDTYKARLRESLGIPPENKVLLYAGRLAKEKKLDEIIGYLGRIKPPKTTFLIVGDGPERPNIEKRVRECIGDMTVMTGMIAPGDMRLYYGISDIFTNASQSETQGLTYIEALANGLPLLCRRDKCLDGVLEDGVTGYGYENEEEYARRLKQMLDGDLGKMSQNAVELTHSKYSLEKFADTVYGIYRECIENYPKNSRKSAHVRLSIGRRRIQGHIRSEILKTLGKIKQHL